MKIDNKAFIEYMKEYKKKWGTTQPDILEIIAWEVDYVFKTTRRISNRITKIKNILNAKQQMDRSR